MRAKAPEPISRRSHAIGTPVASIARRAASTTSGPMPSPGMKRHAVASRVSSSGDSAGGRRRPARGRNPRIVRSGCRSAGRGYPCRYVPEDRAAPEGPSGPHRTRAERNRRHDREGAPRRRRRGTKISDIDGERGKLWYVGYPIEDLAEHATFEEVVYLLHHGELPTTTQLDELTRFIAGERKLSPFGTKMMPTLADTASPMSMLRTMVSGTSTFDPDGWDDSARRPIPQGHAADREDTHDDRELPPPAHGPGGDPAEPQARHAANFLWMLLGEEATPEDVSAMDLSFVLYADHTMNASTFTARIIASTLADMFSAITGAIAALKGPLHGGANEESMKMLEEIDKPENAESYVAERLDRKEKIFGFGHAVYTTMDPRARDLQGVLAYGRRGPRRSRSGTRSRRRSKRRPSSRRGCIRTSTSTRPACTTCSASRPT